MQQLTTETPTATTHQPSVAQYIAACGALKALSQEESASEIADSEGCVLERGGYSVRPIDTSAQRARASTLIDRRYAWRGYDTDGITALPENSRRITLEASSGEHLFATLTLGLDSDRGLLADQLYKAEIDAFRKLGCRVCEVSRLAIEPEFGTKEVLGALFYVTYIYARIIHKATDAFVEVHPRHARFYVRMLGFHQIGEIRICPRVDAPAVLLHLELDYMDAQIARHHSSCGSRDRSLYPYFLAHGEVASLATGLTRGRHAGNGQSNHATRTV